MSICAEQLRQVPLFASMDSTQRRQIVALLDERHLAAGTRVLCEDRGSQSPLIVLLEGSVRTTKRGADGRHHCLLELVAPAVFGEMDVLAARPPLASVTASTRVRLAYLFAARIETGCRRGDTALLELLESLGRSLRRRRLDHRLRRPLAGRVGPLQRLLYTGHSTRQVG